MSAKTKKANTAPKSKPMPNGRSVHADEPKREPLWNDRRVAIVKAMRKLNATNRGNARTAGEIQKVAQKAAKELAGDDGLARVKIILDVYRTTELLHNGFAQSVREEGERELRYFLTKRGTSTTFPQKSKKSDE
jgi:hypothetical protein